MYVYNLTLYRFVVGIMSIHSIAADVYSGNVLIRESTSSSSYVQRTMCTLEEDTIQVHTNSSQINSIMRWLPRTFYVAMIINIFIKKQNFR